MTDISLAELVALQTLDRMGGGLLTSWINETNSKDEFGEIVPGIRVYRKLDNKGYVVITDEEPCDDGFEFTPMIDLTDLGKQILKREIGAKNEYQKPSN